MPTKVMEPLDWAFPSVGLAHREVLTRLPAQDDGRPPLLFVHGLGHGAWCWDEHWMPAAAERGWPCYAVSLRGHGGSGGDDRIRRWQLRDYAHDVLQAIVDLPAPPVLIGHSMGALVVRRVLARYPARAAVLLTPAGARHGARVALALGRHRPAQLARALALQPVRLDAELLFSDELDRVRARGLAARLTPESPLAQLEIILSPRPTATATDTPVLVLGGGDDPLIPVGDVVATARAYGTRAHVFRGMGHDLMLDARWRQPLDLMLDWLEQSAV
jgi:pimeloyl-ACP methyl ester carboxylesterase